MVKIQNKAIINNLPPQAVRKPYFSTVYHYYETLVI